MTFDEFRTAEYEPGFKYELIHGRLEVSPLPDSKPPAGTRAEPRRLGTYNCRMVTETSGAEPPISRL